MAQQGNSEVEVQDLVGQEEDANSVGAQQGSSEVVVTDSDDHVDEVAEKDFDDQDHEEDEDLADEHGQPKALADLVGHVMDEVKAGML